MMLTPDELQGDIYRDHLHSNMKNGAAIMLVVFTVATLGSTITWAGFGVALRKVLKNERHARIFNVVMALLLVASIVPMVL